MIFSVPIYVEEQTEPGRGTGRFMVRPLFAPEPVQHGEKLTRALTRLANDLHQQMKTLGEDRRQDALAPWAFSPSLEERTLELRLEFGSSTARRSFFLAGYAALGRKVWFCPRVPNLWFEVFPDQDLLERAGAALSGHFKALEKTAPVDLADYVTPGRARLTVLEIELHPATLTPPGPGNKRAAIFGGDEKMDGERELRRTGRSLNMMYPDDLDRAVGREREIEELARLLASTDRRPLLLVGPRRVGKTALLHELVWRMQSRKGERHGGGRQVWLLSPMRLISGMSFLGQWENRVLAILDHARRKDLVVYFDDLPGLFAAGISSASDLNVAQVLKPALDRREVRVIGEVTPETWRVLRERDRTFADLFQVLPVEEPSEAGTLQILIETTRQLEEAHRCTFDLDVVPAVYEMHRRFVPSAAFPGKAAGFLRRIARQLAGATVGRTQALAEFREQCGLELTLLDEQRQLSRPHLIERLEQSVQGQRPVLEAFADRMVALKARLNDPHRPLGTLLLLGPTGVGKTQSAKALATQLFGGPERLLRFDMNEFVDAASAARLIGTAREPDGLLTGPIQRQPFCVVLFDEIEKAAPEVYDILLAVLDEGRLTDSWGRVADFTQAILLLTSNLGVQEARSRLGFGAGDEAADDQVFISAAEKFFRPEFFNRLDRVVPFRALTPAHLEGIARQLLDNVLARDGLQRRNSWLTVSPAAMKQLVAQGYHPQLGARALKRVVEREVTQPVAGRLAALSPGDCLLIALDWANDGFQLGTRELPLLSPTVSWPTIAAQERTPSAQAAWTRRILTAANAVLDRVDASLESHAPTGRIEVGKLSAAQERYFAAREQFKRVERLLEAAERSLKPARRGPGVTHPPVTRPVKVILRKDYPNRTLNPRRDRERDAIAIRDVVTELGTEIAEGSELTLPDSPVIALLRELALLEVMGAKLLAADPETGGGWLLLFETSSPDDALNLHRLARWYAGCLNGIWGLTAQLLLPSPSDEELLMRRIFNEAVGRIQGCYVAGPGLDVFLPPMPASVLNRRADGTAGLIALNRSPVASDKAARSAVQRRSRRTEPLAAEHFGPILHRFNPVGALEDLRSGLSIPGASAGEEFRVCLLSGLPLPPELDAVIGFES